MVNAPPKLNDGGFSPEAWTFWIERHWWKVLIGLIAICLGVSWAVLKTLGERRLERARQAILDAGEPLTMADVEALRPSIPDDENMALRLLEIAEALFALQSSEPVQEHMKQVPLVGVASLPRPGERLPPEQMDAARAYLAACADVMEPIRQAAQLQTGRYPVVWQIPAVDTRTPYLGIHRHLTRLVALVSVTAAMEDRFDDAHEVLLWLPRLDRALATEPVATGFIVRLAGHGLFHSTTQYILSIGEFSAEQLRDISQSTTRFDLGPSFRWALVTERAAHLDTMDWVYRNMRFGESEWTRSLLPGRAAVDRAIVVRQMTELREATSLSLSKALHRMRTIGAASNTAIWGEFVIPSMVRAGELWCRGIAMNRALQAALAAEQFRLRQQRWPDALDELVPDYLDAVPLDPFDDQPLRYIHDEAGVRIYSIGEDMLDDDGEIWGYTQLKRPPDYGCYLLHPHERGRRPAADVPVESASAP
jgi:hypothetical protein